MNQNWVSKKSKWKDLLPFWTRWSLGLVLIPRFSFLISLMVVQEQEPHPIQIQILKLGRSYAELCRQGKKWICSAYPKVGKLGATFTSYSCCKGEFWGEWLRPAPRYSWRLFGGRREASLLCRIFGALQCRDEIYETRFISLSW